jgi:hypothetical protein
MQLQFSPPSTIILALSITISTKLGKVGNIVNNLYLYQLKWTRSHLKMKTLLIDGGTRGKKTI